MFYVTGMIPRLRITGVGSKYFKYTPGNRPEFRKPDNGNENKMIYLASHNVLFDFCLSRIACCYTAIILHYYIQRFRRGNDEPMNDIPSS